VISLASLSSFNKLSDFSFNLKFCLYFISILLFKSNHFWQWVRETTIKEFPLKNQKRLFLFSFKYTHKMNFSLSCISNFLIATDFNFQRVNFHLKWDFSKFQFWEKTTCWNNDVNHSFKKRKKYKMLLNSNNFDLKICLLLREFDNGDITFTHGDELFSNWTPSKKKRKQQWKITSFYSFMREKRE
jgi:hypothetical protein